MANFEEQITSVSECPWGVFAATDTTTALRIKAVKTAMGVKVVDGKNVLCDPQDPVKEPALADLPAGTALRLADLLDHVEVQSTGG